MNLFPMTTAAMELRNDTNLTFSNRALELSLSSSNTEEGL